VADETAKGERQWRVSPVCWTTGESEPSEWAIYPRDGEQIACGIVSKAEALKVVAALEAEAAKASRWREALERIAELDHVEMRAHGLSVGDKALHIADAALADEGGVKHE
jgi:hypothetical protein